MVKLSRELDLLEKKTYGYRERDEEARKEFLEKIRGYAPERFVYIMGYLGRFQFSNSYLNRVSAMDCPKHLGLCYTIAPMVFEGYCHTELVCEWMEQLLLPELLPGQIIIIDNASFHPKERIKKLMAKAGCEVLFLPAYSPDLNKIEKFWARLKNYVSQIINDSENLVDAVSKALRHLS